MPEHGLEHAVHTIEHGAHENEKIPAFITAVLAVFLALASLGGHRSHTEAILKQAQAVDQWAYYQSSRIKLSTQEDIAESVGELIAQLATKGDATMTGLSSAYDQKIKKKVKKYQEKSEEIKTRAEELEHEVHRAEKKANYFDIGEIFIEVAIVLASLTFLTKRSIFWKVAALSGTTGVVIAAMSFLSH